MAVYSGKDGSLEWDNTITTRIQNWSLESSLDTLDTTSLGDIARTFVAGLKSATGSVTIFYHDDNRTLAGILNNIITPNSAVPGRLELIWAKRKIAFDALINSSSITCSVGEVMSASLTFTMTGDYLIVDL